jgi:hypothetical protein
VAKGKELNLTVAIALQPEHEQTDDETQVVLDAGKDHRRLGW